VDRIDLLDAGFLHLETREAPMHVAGLNLFEFPKGANQRKFMARLGETYRSSTELRKPFAHRVAQGMLGRFGPLYWEEDPDLDLDYHVQHAALPKPGRYRELFALVSRLHSTLLDRSRPLWEAHLIEGLQNRQFAVYSKLHHATIDGVAGVRITEGGCSPDPDAEINVSPLSIEAHERYKAKHGKTRNADPGRDQKLRGDMAGPRRRPRRALAACPAYDHKHPGFECTTIRGAVLEYRSSSRRQRCGRRDN
jgi:diacylglycerol O-acyltransferase